MLLYVRDFHLSATHAAFAAKLHKLIMNNEIHAKFLENLRETCGKSQQVAARQVGQVR